MNRIHQECRPGTRKQGLTLLKGTLDILILKTLSLGPCHGYGIAKRVERMTGHAISIQYGVLYQALLRMEARDWLLAEEQRSPAGRNVKAYHLTDLGCSQLKEKSDIWDQYVAAMNSVLHAVEICD